MMFDHPNDEPILVLTDEQCWQLLERIQHGRLVAVVDGRADIFPVNVIAHQRALVFRTAPGTKLAELTINENVLFEADGILPDQAWSVIVRGAAEQLQTSAELAKVRKLDLRPWTPTLKDHFVRITPTEVSGRHFRFGDQPERELGEGSEVG